MTRTLSMLKAATVVLLVLVAALASAPSRADVLAESLSQALSEQGLRVSLADSGDLSDGAAPSYGLFIGINRYPLLAGWDLAGCVSDVWALRSLLTARFGLGPSALLTNAQATRQAIGTEFAALVEVVEERRRAGALEPVTVVIAFAGHGRRVIALTDEEEDGLDETWVAADSDIDATNDIRDDELHRVYRRLAQLGAQTIIVSDSCHSGSMHRQSVRIRAVHHEHPPFGPRDAHFDQFGAGATRGTTHRDAPLPGMVFYAACHQAQKASEHTDELGQPCGRFTFALRNALTRVGPETSYRELFDLVQREFDRLWPDDRSQTPQFHADPRKAGERFLRGGPAIAHATILPRSLADTPTGASMRLSMGSLDGVSIGASFRIFRTLDDLAAGGTPVATVRVTEVGPLACVAEWTGAPSECPVTIHDKGLLDAARWRDFTVALGPDVPEEIARDVRALEAAEQIALSRDGTATPDVVVHRVPGSDAIGIYRPGSEPGPHGAPDALGRTPAPWFALEPTAESERSPDGLSAAVIAQLLHVARMQRLMSLETVGAGAIDPIVQPQQRGADGQLVSVNRDTADGAVQLRDGDLFTIRLRNPFESTMHVVVLALDEAANLHLLFPLEESDLASARRGRTLDIAAANPFVARLADADRRDAERIRIKVIASTTPLDLTALTFRPSPEQHGVRQRSRDGISAPSLFNLLSDLAFGGPATRTAGQARVEESWAAATVGVGIGPAE